jgi:hypothetical protein
MARAAKPGAKAGLRGIAAAPDTGVAAVFKAYPPRIRSQLTALRRLILDTAQATDGVGAIKEALRWGQPSYLTTETGSGSSIRIDRVRSVPGRYAIYFHCQTDLVAGFRELYPALTYGGNRSILLDASQPLPSAELRHCITLALTYHLDKRKARRR